MWQRWPTIRHIEWTKEKRMVSSALYQGGVHGELILPSSTRPSAIWQPYPNNTTHHHLQETQDQIIIVASNTSKLTAIPTRTPCFTCPYAMELSTSQPNRAEHIRWVQVKGGFHVLCPNVCMINQGLTNAITAAASKMRYYEIYYEDYRWS